MTYHDAKLTLYTYFRSSCSARVRTAAALKRIKLHFEYINLLKGEQGATSYTNLNPSGAVPTLIVESNDGGKVVIRQSTAILEFFEEVFPDSVPLLPKDPARRAQVRELYNILAADFQPRTNLCIIKRVSKYGVTAQDWCQEQMPPVLQAFEDILKACAGMYCVGDEVTLADIALAPALEGALRWGIDISQFTILNGVFERIRVLPEFVQADWKHQEDTPAELRYAPGIKGN
ncbi:maleylacetoacetate isomerase maia [Truncatella angustata]|uniref:Maleylacetoacetate isomerase maia n=1 Tax=Truncatella angustata TaxID=152316 RepID=A0A9P8RID6_9PEZI|nr:maleylacetoacetate isomerase maia [Truncatella angustata]KAH6646593.1 maleylacetoacetate isomerase maia [Truncatella angustata]